MFTKIGEIPIEKTWVVNLYSNQPFWAGDYGS